MANKAPIQTQGTAVQMEGFLGWVERMGNMVPHPVYLFLCFLVIAFILSAVLSSMGLQAVNPATKKVVTVVNMLTSEKLANFMVNSVREFINFPPVGLVTFVTMGLGVATGSGLLQTTLKLAGMAKSKVATTMFVVLIGINGNLVGDAAFVIYPPLVALLFKATGRNPLAGLFTAFASVSCGFGANFFVGAGDMSLAGMTEAAARIIDPKYIASPAFGWYFLFASTLFLAPVGTWVTHRFIEPKLNQMGLGVSSIMADGKERSAKLALTADEQKGLKYAVIAFLMFILAVAALTLPGLPFAAPKGKTVLEGQLLRSIAFLIFIMFFLPGYVYGKAVGTIKKFEDSIKMMINEVKTLAGFLVICCFAAQFIAVFRDSNIGLIIAIYGGNFLKQLNIQGPLLLASFVILIAFINLFMGSANAKWALLSSVFVPMLMIAGISPAGTQLAYRMGDGLTNNLTPTLPYLAIILGYAQEYDPRARAGTVMAYMLPYTIWFSVFWIAFLLVWLYLDIPVGPGYRGFM